MHDCFSVCLDYDTHDTYKEKGRRQYLRLVLKSLYFLKLKSDLVLDFLAVEN